MARRSAKALPRHTPREYKRGLRLEMLTVMAKPTQPSTTATRTSRTEGTLRPDRPLESAPPLKKSVERRRNSCHRGNSRDKPRSQREACLSRARRKFFAACGALWSSKKLSLWLYLIEV